MLSLSSYPGAGAPDTVGARPNGRQAGVFREGSRGLARTPQNATQWLDESKESAVGADFRGQLFFSGRRSRWRRKIYHHLACDFREYFAKPSREIRQVIEVIR